VVTKGRNVKLDFGNLNITGRSLLLIGVVFSSINIEIMQDESFFQQCYQSNFAHSVKSDGDAYGATSLAGVTCHLPVSPQATVIFSAMSQMEDDWISAG